MPLKRDEGGVDFLKPRAYPRAKGRALEAALRYWRLMAAAERQWQAQGKEQAHRDANSCPRELLSSWSLSDLCEHPMDNANLARLNWLHERPRLDVGVTLGGRDRELVEVVVAPARETLKRVAVPGFWGGTVLAVESTDFRNFAGRDGYGGIGSVTVMSLSVSAIVLRDRSTWYGFREHADMNTVAAVREFIVYAVQHKLHQLSETFNCRVDSRLIVFGKNKDLEVRSGERAPWKETDSPWQGRAAERDGQTSVLDVTGWNCDEIREFIKRHKVCATWLHSFVGSRRSDYTPQELAEAIAAYMELPYQYVPSTLAESLIRATDKEAAQAKVRDLLMDKSIVSKYIDERRSAGKWIDDAAAVAGVTFDSMARWLLSNYTKLMADEGLDALSFESMMKIAGLVAPRYHEKVAKEKNLSRKARAAVEEALKRRLKGRLPNYVMTEPGRPLSRSAERDLLRDLGFRQWDDACEWAKPSLPGVAQWLSAIPRASASAEQKVGK